MPIISGCNKVLILSSFEFAVLVGRTQLFEMMKRGCANLLAGVVKPRSTGTVNRPVVGLGQDRRRKHNFTVEIQNYWRPHTKPLGQACV